MAFKRQIDRLPIIPAGREGVQRHLPLLHRRLRLQSLHMGRRTSRAAQRPDRTSSASTCQAAGSRDRRLVLARRCTTSFKQNGEDVHIVIKPDKDCVVNSGLGSIRGARMAEMSYSRARNTQLQRLTDPMVWRYGQMQPTSWDDALDLVARVTVAVINDRARTDCSSPPSITAARAAATRIPGAPESSISVP